MRKTFYYIACICCIGLLFGACSKEISMLTPEQRELLGTPVNFNASMADPFATRATYREDGSFNHGDLMYIYRQYKESGVFQADPVTFHVYYNDIDEKGLGWTPAAGKIGWDKDEKTDPAPHAFTQNKESYLNWDNDKTVRFRSIFRSNYAGTRTGGKGSYYPDFGLSDWVSAGGPTQNIPLHVSHLGSRIVISPRNGIEANQIERVEICLEEADYKREDNADTQQHDTDDKWGDAATRAAAVRAVYERMCMPSGVDLAGECLYAMDKTYYDGHSNFEDVEHMANSAAHVGFATKTPAQVITDIQRPVFTGRINTSCYLITIPYDFSNGTGSGEILTLPPYTRFRVYMYDVNNGDAASTSGYEKEYHIFALNDIKDGENPVYPDGLKMSPGSSYRFRVGYRYKTFTVERDANTSWTEQDLAGIDGTKDVASLPTLTYVWWVNEMNARAEDAVHSNNFDPVFDITNMDEFVSCMNLINGTATTKTGAAAELKHAFTIEGGVKVEGWYDPDPAKLKNAIGDTIWRRLNGVNIDATYFTESGNTDYIFYKHYHPQDGDKAAYIEEDYWKGAFPFSDASLNKRFTINLTSDFDMKDAKLPATASGTAKFMGIIEGNMHTISNIYTQSGYLFDNVEGATITDLLITSTHKMALVKNVMGDQKTTYIAGVSMLTDCTSASFVETVKENSSLCIVGCIHDGDAGMGLIGATETGAKVTMMGCMNTGRVTSGGNLCGNDVGGTLKPKTADKNGEWTAFMCNYYNTELNPGAKAVGTVTDAYAPQEYIRGSENDVLKAHEDLMLPYKAAYDARYYGYAPWRAMNAAIDYYNNNMAETAEMCNAKFVIRSTSPGFDNLYPRLTSAMGTGNEISSAEGAGLRIPDADN